MALMFQRAAFILFAHLTLTGEAASPAMTPQNLLVWNPHWQCFVWNQNDCAGHVLRALNTFLVAFDLDFAGVIELGDLTYTPTIGWDMVSSRCGHDVVHLFYNTKRWSPTNGTLTPGCMLQYPTTDRPFVLQHFSAENGAELIAVAAHFPHPRSLTQSADEYSQSAATEHLQLALADLMQKTGTEKVVLMADTNAYKWISNELIWATQLSLPGPVIGSRLMNTCCLDAEFPPDFTFDRIIVNFGDAMFSSALYNPVDLPNWTRQVLGDKVGAFHRPVLGRVETVPTQSHIEGPIAALWTAVILLGISTLILASALCALVVRKPCRRMENEQDWTSEETSSSD